MNKPAFKQVRVWDLFIRLFHWSLAGTVAFQLYSGETGEWFYDWHRYIGEGVLVLVVFRLVWGFVGSDTARLMPLLTRAFQAPAHLWHVVTGRKTYERGHNPAGGLAVLALLGLCLLQGITGLFITDEEEYLEGAFYGSADSYESLLYDLHMMGAEILMILVFIHIAMVFVYLIRLGQNLIMPMIGGSMKWPTDVDVPIAREASVMGGVLLFIGVAALAAFLLSWFG